MSRNLTISLLSYNGEKYLPFCLDSVFNQSFKDWELVIIDNNSQDDSVRVIKSKILKHNHKARLARNNKNIGFASGHNKVLNITEGDYILVLNQDVILGSDYCWTLVDFLSRTQDAGAAVGKIKQWNVEGGGGLTGARKTDKIDTAGLRVFKSFRVVDLGAGEADQGQYDENQEIFGVSGCCPVYRREALSQVGFFDSDFFTYKEDVDLAFRLRNYGWKTFRVGRAEAYHQRGISEKNKRRERPFVGNYLSYRNHLFMLIKNLAWPDFCRYGIWIFYYEFKKFFYLLLFEQKTLYAWVEAAQKFRKMREKRGKVRSVRRWIS